MVVLESDNAPSVSVMSLLATLVENAVGYVIVVVGQKVPPLVVQVTEPSSHLPNPVLKLPSHGKAGTGAGA